jgi:ketosteroid isomerase-like protein
MRPRDLSPDEPAFAVVIAFNDALNAHDADAMMRLMTPDCVFENTHPPPDGTRYEGSAAVRAFWEEFFRASEAARIEIEEIFALEDRCVMRWTYHWIDAGGRPGHVRGVDIYTVRDGLIAEKLSYVKG